MDSIGNLYLDFDREALTELLEASGKELTKPMMEFEYEPPVMKNERVYHIIVEGNIGSGKTTFLDIFRKCAQSCGLRSLVVPEPIDKWRNVGGQNLFQLLADDPKRWSFTFQSYVYKTMSDVSVAEVFELWWPNND